MLEQMVSKDWVRKENKEEVDELLRLMSEDASTHVPDEDEVMEPIPKLDEDDMGVDYDEELETPDV